MSATTRWWSGCRSTTPPTTTRTTCWWWPSAARTSATRSCCATWSTAPGAGARPDPSGRRRLPGDIARTASGGAPRMTAPTMRTVTLPDGSAAPALGMGTWYLGEDPDSTRAHVIENRAALEIGFSQAELDQLDRIFPPPFGKVPLDVL